MYFKDATEQEIQKGKDYVANLSTRKIVKEYDMFDNEIGERSELDFRPLDASLSKVAQQTAKPLLEKKYALALSNDISKNIEQIRLDSTDSNDFQTKINNFMPSYIEEINKLGGGDFTSQIQEGVAKLSTQHYFDMALDEKKLNIVNQAQDGELAIRNSMQEITAEASNYINSDLPLEELIKQLQTQKKETKGVFDGMVSEFGLTGFTKTQIKNNNLLISTAIPRGLMQGYSRGRTSLQIELAERYIGNGQKDPRISENEYKILDVIKKLAGKNIDVIRAEARTLSTGQRQVQSDTAVEEQRKNRKLEEDEAKIKESLVTQQNNSNFDIFITNEAPDNIVNDWIENGQWNEKTFRSLNDRIQASIGVKNKDATFGFIDNNDTEAKYLHQDLITQTVDKLFQHPDTINTAASLANVNAKLTNPNKQINLTKEEQTFYDAMQSLANNYQDGKSRGLAIIQNKINRLKSQSVASAVGSEQTQSINNTIVNDRRRIYTNDKTSKKNRDITYGVTADTFITSDKPDSFDPANNDNHEALDRHIMSGGMSQKLIEVFGAVADGNFGKDQEEAALKVLSLWSRYSNTRDTSSTLPFNVLVRDGGLSSEQNSIFAMAADLYTDFKGKTEIFNVAGTGPNNQVQLTQIIRLIKETNQVPFNKESIKQYGDKVAISDPATTYLASLGLRTNEIFDFKSVAKIGIKLNIAEPKLRSIIMDMKDKLYVDTPFVIDPFFSSIRSKSKFGFKRAIPNQEKREEIINLINADLPDNAMLFGTTFIQPKTLLDDEFEDTDYDDSERPTTGIFKDVQEKLKVGQGATDVFGKTLAVLEQQTQAEGVPDKKITKKGVSVVKDQIFLAPVVTAFTGGDTQKSNMLYQALFFDSMYGSLRPYLPEGKPKVYNLDSLLNKIKTPEEINKSLDTPTSKEDVSVMKITGEKARKGESVETKAQKILEERNRTVRTFGGD
tara:strand:+ start:1 stop:2868 length:2868 start_codon:yes stop_codon:yes gene_type:complete